MPDQMTATERGHRALRESGYASGGAVHGDETEDKALIKSELSKARISTRSKGGKIKGAKASENPGRRHRAAGGSVDNDPQIDRDQNPDDDAPSKLARGGRAHSKPGIGKVNIVIAHPGGGAAPPGGPPMAPPHPPMAAPPMAPTHPPMMPPPGAMPPGAGGPPPPGPPPGGAPMMRPQGIRHGGHVRDVMGRFQGGGV